MIRRAFRFQSQASQLATQRKPIRNQKHKDKKKKTTDRKSDGSRAARDFNFAHASYHRDLTNVFIREAWRKSRSRRNQILEKKKENKKNTSSVFLIFVRGKKNVRKIKMRSSHGGRLTLLIDISCLCITPIRYIETLVTLYPLPTKRHPHAFFFFAQTCRSCRLVYTATTVTSAIGNHGVPERWACHAPRFAETARNTFQLNGGRGQGRRGG